MVSMVVSMSKDSLNANVVFCFTFSSVMAFFVSLLFASLVFGLQERLISSFLFLFSSTLTSWMFIPTTFANVIPPSTFPLSPLLWVFYIVLHKAYTHLIMLNWNPLQSTHNLPWNSATFTWASRVTTLLNRATMCSLVEPLLLNCPIFCITNCTSVNLLSNWLATICSCIIWLIMVINDVDHVNIEATLNHFYY